MADNNPFIGRGWTFPPKFRKISENYGEARMAQGEADIDQSLSLLFGTSTGERVMLPDYGTGISTLVFKKIDNSLKHFIIDMVKTAIVRFEPRITVNNINVDVSRQLDGIVLVDIDYTVRTTNSRSNIVYPFYLEEGSLVHRPS